MNWESGTPPVSDTGKSKVYCCKCIWENETYLTFAFYNSNTNEWITSETHQVIEVINWGEIKL